jgi:hypothetical protein
MPWLRGRWDSLNAAPDAGELAQSPSRTVDRSGAKPAILQPDEGITAPVTVTCLFGIHALFNLAVTVATSYCVALEN